MIYRPFCLHLHKTKYKQLFSELTYIVVPKIAEK